MLTNELHRTRDELKILEREMDHRAEISKSVNAASLLIEKEYRELCRKNKINDVLMVKAGDGGEYQFRDFDPTQAKTPTRKTQDKRMLNPIWRGIQDDKKLEEQNITDEEEKRILAVEKEILKLTFSDANTQILLQKWKEALHSRRDAKHEEKRDEKDIGEKKKEILRLETSINDKKNVELI